MSAVHGRGARHVRRHLPAAPRVNHAERAKRHDTERVETAASLQTTCRAWLVIWSPWRRTFTGFACFTAERVIIDEAEKDAFLECVKQVELAAAVGPLSLLQTPRAAYQLDP